jgi:hypothetical protein
MGVSVPPKPVPPKPVRAFISVATGGPKSRYNPVRGCIPDAARQCFDNSLYMNPLRGSDNRADVRSPTDMHPLPGMGVGGDSARSLRSRRNGVRRRVREKKKGGGRKSSLTRKPTSAALLFPFLTPCAAHHSARREAPQRNLLRLTLTHGIVETQSLRLYTQVFPK